MRVGCYGLYVAVGAQRFECLTNPGALLGAEFPVGVREVVVADSQQRKCAFDAFQVTRSVFSDGIDRCADLHDAALDFADAGDVVGACGVVHGDVEFGKDVCAAVHATVGAEQDAFARQLFGPDIK